MCLENMILDQLKLGEHQVKYWAIYHYLISRLLDSILSWIGCDYLVIFSYLTFATLHCISLAITFALYHTCWTLSCPELAALVFSFLLHHQNALAKLSQLLGHRQQSFQAKSSRSFDLLIAEVISVNLGPKISLSLRQIGHWVKV